ncbi:MAG: hypothetical protein V4667_13085 [Bacteroidota bacterium]
MKSNLAIVVQSCDKYDDLWNGFYTLFFRYWKNCSYPIYHITETKTCSYPGVITINTQNVTTWSDMLKYGLEKIKEDYVLYLLEDYFLIKPIDETRIEKAVEIVKKENAACLRLVPVPGPDRDFKDYTDIGEISKNSAYSLSTQASIWNKNILENFILKGETGWQFENQGSQRAKNISEVFLGIKSHSKTVETGNYPYTYCCTAVYKGKWMREAIDLCKKENITINTTIRPIETRFENFYRHNYSKSPQIIKQILDIVKSKL